MIERSKGQIDFNAIRSAHPLPTLAGNLPKFTRAGNEFKACCPFHSEKTPSFTIFAGGAKFHCFGCGAHGDVVDYVRLIEGVSHREAAERLNAGKIPEIPVQSLPAVKDRRTQDDAARIWRQSTQAAQTPVSAYLASRGLCGPIPPSLRFCRDSYGFSGPLLPCMVALVVDVAGNGTGIQRTYLLEDGSGKADVEIPKRALGRISGGAIRLSDKRTSLVFVTGGIEDGLTLQAKFSLPAYAVTGEAMMSRLELPDHAQRVWVGADNDEAGERSAQAAAATFIKQGRLARIMRPYPGFKDFNEELIKGAAK